MESSPAPQLMSSSEGALPTLENRASREQVANFFQRGIEQMRSDVAREQLRVKCATRPGIQLIEMQRSAWDSVGVDRDFGCACLNQMTELYPGDDELQELCQDFILTSQRTYMQAIEDMKPAELEAEKPMGRLDIIEFFDACNVKMGLPEFQKELRDHLNRTKMVPNELIQQAQKDVLEIIGFEREHGCKCLGRIQAEFPSDSEVMQGFAQWQQMATRTCSGVVQTWAVDTGEQPQMNGEMAEMMDRHKKINSEIAGMAPEEQTQLLGRMQPIVEACMRLSPPERISFVGDFDEVTRDDFMKAQVLLMQKMRSEGHKPEAASSSDPAVPSQQQMM